MFLALLRSRRFAGLFWCQFLSAFNDNFVRNLLATLILFHIGRANAGALITLTISAFILPSALLSGLAGELADAYDKGLIAQRLKIGEICVQAIAAAGLWFGSLPLLYVALCGLGTISALFVPVKYGFLPERLEVEELPAGNALVEAGMFLAVVLGLVGGALASDKAVAPWMIVTLLMLVAVATYAVSLFIPYKGPAAPGLPVHANILASSVDLLRQLYAQPNLWNPGLATAWFWVTSAVALALVPVAVRHATGGGIAVTATINGIFALGIGVGSLTSARLARGRISIASVPAAAIGMAVFSLALAVSTLGLPAPHAHDVSLTGFFATARGLTIVAEVFGLAVSGGVFAVPLSAIVQARSAPERRARTIASVNIQIASLMGTASLLTALLQSRLFGLGEPALLALLGLGNIAAAICIRRAIGGAETKIA
jgi:hypothetical protein